MFLDNPRTNLKMKLILQLNVLFACFWSAKLLICRVGLFGSVDKPFVRKELNYSTIDCPAKAKFCVKEVCFQDGKAENYVNIYACTDVIKDCNTDGTSLMAYRECRLKNKGIKNACKNEKEKNEAAFVKKYGSNYRCEQCQYGHENEDKGNENFAPYRPDASLPPKPEIASTAPPPNPVNASVAPPPPNPENSSVPVPPKPENGIDIVFSDMEIPLGVPPSAGSGRSTKPGIGHHFVMVFVAVALVGTAIRHGILL